MPFVFCVAFFVNVDWFMQRGQTAMFARKIIYTPYFYLQKRKHMGFINEFSWKTRLSLIDRMTKHKNLVMLWIECIYNQWQYIIELNLKRYFNVLCVLF